MARNGKKPASVTKRGVTPTDRLIANRLKARRLELHMSQDELGKRLGVRFQQVQKYEKGVNRLGAGRLHQVCQILETNIDYFMGDLSDGKSMVPSKLAVFMATKDGLDMAEAMMRLNQPHQRAVIALARTLGNAYG